MQSIGDIKKGIDKYDTLNNDNVSNIYINNNDNVKIQQNINKSIEKSKQVDFIADKLVEAFNNPSARAYYCKLAWLLPESAIWVNYEQALAGKSPVKLFTYLCERTKNGR